MARKSKKAEEQIETMEGMEMNMEEVKNDIVEGEGTNMTEMNQEVVNDNIDETNDELFNKDGEDKVNDAPETQTEGKTVYTDADGKEISCSAFCRLMFLEHNMSKRQIADDYGINYRTVYGACLNLSNEAVEESRGRSAKEAKIILNAAGLPVVMTKEGKTLVNGVEVDPALSVVEGQPEEVFTEVDRKEWVLAQVAAGVEKAEIAKKLNVSHGVIYAITKDSEGTTRARVKLTLEDGTVVERTEYIRKLHAEGMERKDIAKLLDVAYNVVYQATKESKSAQDKYVAAVEVLAKYEEVIAEESVEAFKQAIDTLKELNLKAEKEETEATETTEEVANVEPVENVEAAEVTE